MLCISTLVIYICASLQLIHSCDEEHIKMCEDRFANDLGVTIAELEAAVMPNVDEDYLREVCRAFGGYKDCIRSFSGYCPFNIRLQIKALENMFGHICGEGFNDHLKYGNCINSNEVGPGVVRCNDELYTKLALFADDKNDACEITKDAIDCIEDEVEKVCGEDAAEYRAMLETLALQPVADQFNCDLEDDKLSGGVIAGIIIGVIILIIICIGICYLCAQRTNNKRYANSREVQAPTAYMITQVGAQAVPPYPGPPSSEPPAYSNRGYEDPSSLHSTKPPVAQSHSYMIPPDDPRDSHMYEGKTPRAPLGPTYSYQTPYDNRRESHTYEAIDRQV